MRSLFKYAAFATCLTALARSAYAGEGVAVNVCNRSMTHALHIAVGYFAEGGNGFLIDEYPYHNVGWSTIEPDRCHFMIEDAAATSEYWFRVESEGRLIRAMDSDSSGALTSFDESQLKFCSDPENAFTRNYRLNESVARGCPSSMPPILYPIMFNFFFTWGKNASYVMYINPDPWIAKYKPEPVEKPVQAPAVGLSSEKVSEVGFQCTCGSHYPSDEAAANAIYHAKVLVCGYGSEQKYQEFVYWHKAQPKELPIWIRQEPEWAGIYGMGGVQTCPANSNEAATLERKFKDEYKRVIGGG